MAALAGLGQLVQIFGLVRAFLAMATVAATGCLPVFLLWFMAIIAFDTPVLPFEFEVRQMMIKGQFVQLDNVKVPAAVIGMTDATFLQTDFLVSAVIAGLFVDVLENVLMAGNAQISLVSLIEFIVAFVTLLFIFRMPADLFARAEKRFNGDCGDATGK